MIKVFDGWSDDFTGQGLGYIDPIRAEITEEPGGMYEIEIELPIDESHDDWLIDHQRIISAPAPTRTSPMINFGLDGKIERAQYIANQACTMYTSKTRKKKIKKFKKGRYFIRLDVDDVYYKVAAKTGGEVGWIGVKYLDFDRNLSETVTGDSKSEIIESVLSREQLFRVYEIKRDTAKMRAIVSAEHISYDLRGVICKESYVFDNVPADEVVHRLQEKADQTDLPFNIYCQCTNAISGDYTGRNLIDCLLNSDDGVVQQCGARLVRDNYDIYILNMEDRYTGVEIRYGDNLISAVEDTDSGNTITRIRPVGKDKDGEPLYIEGDFVTSANAGLYPVQRTKQIEYSEAKTGEDGLETDAKTRARLVELAKKEFEKGADAIKAKIDTEFVRKELAMEYMEAANESVLHMYDIAHVRARKAGIVSDVRMGGYTFDAIPGRERYIDTKITDITDSEPIIYGADIGTNSIYGSKIVNNSLDGALKIKDLSVGIAKMTLAAIEQLNAKSITALSAQIDSLTADDVRASEVMAAIIKAGNLWAQNIDAYSTETDYLTATIANIFKATIEKITAGTVATDELYAAIADITALKVGSLKASDITADRLGAALAAFTVMTAGTAEFDRATVQHLVANALNLSFGTAGDVFIKNLRVAYAQMVSAAIGNLCIKAADGKYYTIGVDQNGNVTATPATVSGSEIDAGQMNDGKVILETNITAENLSTSNLLATYALINSIDAARIDVDQLFAREGFIDRLTTSTLLNDTSIQMLIGRNDELSRWFTFDDEEGFSIRKPAYTDAEGVAHPESIWRFTAMETGIRIYRTDIKQPLLSAEKDCVSAPKIQMGNMLMRATKQGTIVFREVE